MPLWSVKTPRVSGKFENCRKLQAEYENGLTLTVESKLIGR